MLMLIALPMRFFDTASRFSLPCSWFRWSRLVCISVLAGSFVFALTVAAKETTAILLLPGESLPSIQEIVKLLKPAPIAFGVPISDRAAWDAFARSAQGRAAVVAAEKLLKKPLAEDTDKVYMELHREYTPATRAKWDQHSQSRRNRVATFTLAECAENRGRFIPELEHTIRSLCAERSWVFPNYDRQLRDYNGTMITIDLFSSALGWNLATSDRLLGDKLNPEVRALLRRELQRRIFEPFRNMLSGKQPRHWLDSKNNWVAVCLAGVAGTALAQLESPEERAFFVRAALEQSWSFLNGYTEDGYCSEGLGYWNYGFGHYALLAGIVHKATDGRVDLLARKPVYASAAYGARIEMAPGNSPAFADCDPTMRPDPRLLGFLDRHFGFGLDLPPANSTNNSQYLFAELFYKFDAPSYPLSSNRQDVFVEKLRSWFPLGGVYIGRPEPRSTCLLTVAFKGGHNAEEHNHNDVGSYVVLVGGRSVLLDPGQEIRSGRTFSSRRYESKLINSYGHQVPMIAGQLQQTGRSAHGAVLKTEFNATKDVCTLDIRSAYPVPALQKLNRTFVYDRTGIGSLTVVDEADASSPVTFATALITLGSWRQTGPNTLRVEDGGEAVTVEIDTGGKAFSIKGEIIEGPRRLLPSTTRIGIQLDQPETRAQVRLRIVPVVRKNP